MPWPRWGNSAFMNGAGRSSGPPAVLLHLLVGNDRTALLGALVGGAGHGETLALAAVLALALVARAGAAALPLARVDAGTLHVAAAVLGGLRGHHAAGEDERRRRAREQHTLLLHTCLL